ncbi:phosphoribosylanthranilate isomerase [Bacillus sp. T33-2]|uniref:phosphoribosylanthranilate isomerase n=1 Tax=Bacillus sp. T33-2 TaxID=2054168 RepID=UPI000C760288|nr:phosphoribosylanthranilate isomerase [Bacillus sp. T33-2]PLR98813.1 N-(5'-phosphoribosyl)anthranilate isomerase [Bacillus sp. T33-2]
MRVKICGIMDRATAEHAVSAGADALGFVFADSKRRVTPEQAKEMIEGVPGHIWKVGVFVNETKEAIEKIAQISGLTHIQMHGDETDEFMKQFDFPVIKSVSVHSKEDILSIGTIAAQYILLDSPAGKYQGGNGRKFDWALAAGASHARPNIILAGGLDPENVGEAVETVAPFMVDVSSGVETNGRKDREKIARFINNAKTIGEEPVI